MNSIDIVLILIVALSTLGGLMSGFSRLAVGLAASIAGIILGFWFYGIVAGPLLPYVSRPAIANAIGFLVILGVATLAGALLGRMLAKVFKWVGLSWMDRLLGGVAGFARGAILAVALVTVILACVPGSPPRSIVDSKSMPYVLQASRVLAMAVPRELRDAFEQTESKIRGIWDEAKPGFGRTEGRA